MHMQRCTKLIILSREDRNKGFLNEESARQQSFQWPFLIKWFAFLIVRGDEQMSCKRYWYAHRTMLDLAGSSLWAIGQAQATVSTLFRVCCNVLGSFPSSFSSFFLPFVSIYFKNWSLSIYLSYDYWYIWVFIYLPSYILLSVWPTCFMFFPPFGWSKKLFHFSCL